MYVHIYLEILSIHTYRVSQENIYILGTPNILKYLLHLSGETTMMTENGGYFQEFFRHVELFSIKNL